MREILFRGKRKDNGKWMFGTPFFTDGIRRMIYAVVVAPDFTDKKSACYSEGCPVSPETMGQYTGLEDRNGTKIFEGDVLRTSHRNCAAWYVDWKAGSFCVNHVSVNDSCALAEFLTETESEVIGNIYDNPELLEESVWDVQ